MALAVLSPWPSTPAALALARTCLREALGAKLPPGHDPNDPTSPQSRLSDGRIDALGATAAAIVEQYARAGPQPVKNEATIRVAGWLRNASSSDSVPTGVGGITFTWRPTIGRNALRQSGAMGLLSLWHRPRALILEEAE